MATSSMDKGLYQAPQGLPDDEDEGIEIEVGMPDAEGELEIVELPDGSVEVNFEGADAEKAEEGEFGDNLAEFIDEGVLQKLASELEELVDTDTHSRKEWADTFV